MYRLPDYFELNMGLDLGLDLGQRFDSNFYSDFVLDNSEIGRLVPAVDLSLDGEVVSDNQVASSGFFSPATPKFNEFQPNPAGVDPATMSFELIGQAGTAFDLWISVIANEGNDGLVIAATNVTGTFDANGLAVVSIPDIPDPSFTLFMTGLFFGTVGVSDIDGNDDGTMDDLSMFSNLRDAIGILDEASDFGPSYANDVPVGGITIEYTGAEPELVFRDALTGDWYAVNTLGDDTSIFDDEGNNISVSDFNTDPSVGTSFGAINAFAPLDFWLLTDSGFANFVQQSNSFSDTLSAATDNDLIIVTDSASAGDVGSHTISVNNLTIKGASGFEGDFVLDSGVSSIRLIGSHAADITGSEDNNTLIGSQGSNLIFGAGGDDIINGLGGNDAIDGGLGDDLIRGGAGDDFLDGGISGNDTLIGGSGADIFVFTTIVPLGSEADGEIDVIIDFENGTDLIDFSFHSAVNSFDDLTVIDVGDGSHARLLTSNGELIILRNVDAANIDASDFIFNVSLSDPLDSDLDALLV